MNIEDYKITRLPVTIVPYPDKSIFQLYEVPGMFCINISQHERWLHKVTGEEFIIAKNAEYYTPFRIDLQENDYLPGNVYSIYRTDPFDENDLESELYWRNGKVVRNEKGQAIYKMNYYDPNTQYIPYSCIDIGEMSEI